MPAGFDTTFATVKKFVVNFCADEKTARQFCSMLRTDHFMAQALYK
jgi:hypothetical protein